MDNGDNTLKDGFVEDYDDMPFSLKGIDKKEAKKIEEEKKERLKACEFCFAINVKEAEFCTDCGEPFEMKKRTVEILEGQEFVAVERDVMIIERLKAMAYKDVRGKIPASQLRIYALLKNYKTAWWFHTAIDYKYVNVLKEHPAAFDQVRLLLQMQEVAAGTRDLYNQLKKLKSNGQR